MGVGYADGYWLSDDGLRLHYRDYPGDAARVPLLCVPGLTRNARDFEGVAARLAGERRVIVAELRGRGESAWAKDAISYAPPVYLQDLRALIAGLGLARLAMFGTSLGGLLAMMVAASAPGLLAGLLLNDIGPVIEEAGLARIRGYVGRGTSWPTWLHAARGLAEVHGAAYPGYAAADWLLMAHRLCRPTPQGRIVADYDMRIAEPFRLPPPDPAPDPWPLLDGIAGIPALLLHGALSDILSAASAAEMARRLPLLELATVADTGHAPTLDEPECAAAVDRLLARIDAG